MNITSSWQILLYFLFLVISLVLLLNLLIAMMGDTYSDVRDESEVVCRWLFARRVLRMELLLKPFVSIDALRIGKRSHTHRERYHTITFDTYSKDVDDPFDPNPTKRELSEAETKGAGAGVGSRRVPDEIDALAGSVGKNVAAQLRKAIAGGRIDLSEMGALSVRRSPSSQRQAGAPSPSRPVPVQRDGSSKGTLGPAVILPAPAGKTPTSSRGPSAFCLGAGAAEPRGSLRFSPGSTMAPPRRARRPRGAWCAGGTTTARCGGCEGVRKT